MKISIEITPRTALRLVLGVVLVWAALGKLANLQEFYASLVAYRLPLPAALLRLAAITLPWLELLCGLLLLAGLRTGAALGWTVALFAVFALCTGQAWARGLDISCGCLDLRLLGIQPGSGAAAVLESVKFAFFRALLLAAVGAYVLRAELRRADSP